MNAHLNGDNGNSTSDDNKPASEDEISDRLLHVPRSSLPYIYPNIETMRKVYASYVKKQLKEQPDPVVLFLSYYDTTDNVRHVLSSNGVPVKEHEKNGTMIILDIMKVLHNPFFQVPNMEKLRELAKRLRSNSETKQYS